MAILAVNAGSSTLKFSVHPLQNQGVLDPVLIGNIQGLEPAGQPRMDWTWQGQRHQRALPTVEGTSFERALHALHGLLAELPALPPLRAVAHRVVHGGHQYQHSVRITPEVLRALEQLNSLAPLHQPHNLAGIRAFTAAFPELPQVACFDTAFHATLPREESHYALPQTLADQGVREVTLLGQNVNAYDGDGSTLAKLVRQLAKIDGLDRIRYTTSHPRDMGDDLIEAHGELPELMPYLHLPVQAGSDKILKAMNRDHTAESYVKLIEKIRAARPDIAMSGDFIVGFPGERDGDFDKTLELVREVGFASAFSFKYSRRPGTPASAMPGQVDEAVKAERLERLNQLLDEQQRAFNAAQVGKVMPVLFEKSGRHPGQIVGRSPYLQAVHAEGPESLIGTIVPVRIEDAAKMSLGGVLETSSILETA